MYKVGVMMMGNPSQAQKKVKQVVLQVQAKTKVSHIFDYLLELQKITTKNGCSIALQISGDRIEQKSTISQILKYTRPVNGVIKLYLYQQDQQNLQKSGIIRQENSKSKLNLKASRHQINQKQNEVPDIYKKKSLGSLANVQSNKNLNESQAQKKATQGGFCCC